MCAELMSNKNKKTVCLGMIVKNELHIIKECLDSVVKHLDYWIICDTGSTDGTQQFIIDYFSKKNIPGELIERPWKNFGTNRTEVFEYAKGKTDYVLVIDADDILEGNLVIPRIQYDACKFKIKDSEISYFRTQLFINNNSWKYVGVLHEYAKFDGNPVEETILGDYHITSRRLGSRNVSGKYEKDIEILKKALLEEPLNSRYMFYLAQSYRDSGQIEKALEFYTKNIEMNGWNEEVYYSMFQQVVCLIRLEKPFEEILSASIIAFEFRPTRIEAMYELTKYCRLKHRFFLGYHFGKMIQDIPLSNDLLFVHTAMYEYQLNDELSICASRIGQHAEALILYEKLLLLNISDDFKTRVLSNKSFSIPEF
jgi:glycosyltransferase involved in cell wall biosynthesis